MDEITKIALTSSLTIVTGVLLFVVGQFFAKFIIEPVQELKKILGKIRYSLAFHSRPIASSIGKPEWDDSAEETFRKLSCNLRSKIDEIPLYGWWSSLSPKFLPSRSSSLEAARLLMALSHSVHDPDRSKNTGISDKISSLLNLTIDE